MTISAPRILVLDDRPTDRLYLSTILGYRGFTVVEAANGEEGLARAESERPDLVISDVLMPVMDGYEFVRRLRRNAGTSDLPVIFYTATFHEQQARELAEECGVIEILIKPSEPEVILSLVDRVLARGRTAVHAIADEPFGRRHARITGDTLIEKIRDLEASERRMAALVRMGHELLSEREPRALLKRVCEAVRSATQSTEAMVGLISPDFRRFTSVFTTAADPAAADRLRTLAELPPPLKRVALSKQPLRGRTPEGRSQYFALHMPLESFLIVPLTSAERVLGLMAVGNKIGAAEFDAADEEVALTLGVQAGIAYQNAMLINQLEAQAQELLEREATTEFALQAAGIGVYERSFNTGAVRASAGVHELLGVPQGRPLDDFSGNFPEGERERILDIINPAIETCSDFAFDFQVHAGNGRTNYVMSRGQVEADPSGRPKRLLSVLIDMTDRRQLEAQLRQAQKMEAMGQLAAGVAHDFNNLLTVILGYSRFALEDASDDAVRGDVTTILQAGERAVRLTRQLLAFSRSQAREITTFDLNALITELVDMLKRVIGPHIELITRLGEGIGSLSDDRGQIEQVIMNLVVNARDAMPNGGTVTIETSSMHAQGSDWIRIAIGDTGTGMTDETKARMFEPFFTTKGAGKGTGLGLATVFGIVKQSRGHVSVASELGVGSTFTVVLPRVTTAPGPAAAADARGSSGSESILIVEDDPAIKHLAETVLRRAGYTVRGVASSEEALLAARDAPYDLIVSDVLLPGLTGPGLFARVSQSDPKLRVLYISGYAPEETLDVRGLGPREAFLAKPFTPEALALKVRETLDR